MKPNLCDVDAINVDLSFGCLQNPEDSQRQGGLPRSCPSNNSNLK